MNGYEYMMSPECRRIREENKRRLDAELACYKATVKEVRIDNTDFAVNVRDGYVREWGTGRFYDPATDAGYQLDSDGQRIALTSYVEFGCWPQCREAAAYWCDKARKAWDAVRSQQG